MRLTVINKDGTKRDLKAPWNWLIGIPLLTIVVAVAAFIISMVFIFVVPVLLIIAIVMSIQSARDKS